VARWAALQRQRLTEGSGVQVHLGGAEEDTVESYIDQAVEVFVQADRSGHGELGECVLHGIRGCHGNGVGPGGRARQQRAAGQREGGGNGGGRPRVPHEGRPRACQAGHRRPPQEVVPVISTAGVQGPGFVQVRESWNFWPAVTMIAVMKCRSYSRKSASCWEKRTVPSRLRVSVP